jgi:aldose 1-epimerase
MRGRASPAAVKSCLNAAYGRPQTPEVHDISLNWDRVARTPSGAAIDAVTLDNGRGLTARVMSYGATLLELRAPDRHGRQVDTVLGFDDAGAYLGEHPYLGAVIGRYANRIAGGRFALGGCDYVLAANDGKHHLHGGRRGFDKVIWEVADERAGPTPQVVWRYVSRAGEEGYPGNLEVRVSYGLTDDNALRIDYDACTDATTILNLTQHAYWRLGGTTDILGHELRISGSRFLPVDSELIPTGERRPVAGTAMDFLAPVHIGSRIDPADPQIRHANGGYDHTWILDRSAAGLATAARLYEAGCGIEMEVRTTQPGIQFYSGNFLDGSLVGKSGQRYGKHAGLCLEPQHFPDSPHRPRFPSTALQPGDTYRHTTLYRFSIRR